MKYENIKEKRDKEFKRLTGVPHQLFKQMLTIIDQESGTFGRPPTLSNADQLLLTLMYWREYRTQFHIAETYGVSEATVCRTIHKIETMLMNSGQFKLPGRKKLIESDTTIEVILVDATEQAIERPKKTEGALQR
jgi:transcription initiation factor TFIIIB Brf1 subunit/transcription initiation factor TFIIB